MVLGEGVGGARRDRIVMPQGQLTSQDAGAQMQA